MFIRIMQIVLYGHRRVFKVMEFRIKICHFLLKDIWKYENEFELIIIIFFIIHTICKRELLLRDDWFSLFESKMCQIGVLEFWIYSCLFGSSISYYHYKPLNMSFSGTEIMWLACQKKSNLICDEIRIFEYSRNLFLIVFEVQNWDCQTRQRQLLEKNKYYIIFQKFVISWHTK